jgi:glyoxalase/bleomycin resistance protein/dioxygenase superfamily protein
MVGLTTDDVRTDWKRLKAAGVEFVEDPTDYGTLRIATLRPAEGSLTPEPMALHPVGRGSFVVVRD